MLIRQELNISNLKYHMQRQSFAGLFEDVGSFDLGGREWGDDACWGEAVEGTYEVGIVSEKSVRNFGCDVRVGGSLLAVHTPLSPRLKVKNTSSYVWISPFADFSFAVDIPNGLGQYLQGIRPFALKDVVDLVHGGDVGLAAFKGSGNAKQAYQIRVICVEILSWRPPRLAVL